MSCGTCKGHCCAIFTWNRSPQELKDEPENAGGFNEDESRFIADMLIPLSPKKAVKRVKKFGITYPVSDFTKGYFYTCKNWDEKTKLCTVYDKRPRMCKDYPYEKVCDHGCDYEVDQETKDYWASKPKPKRVEVT